MRFARNPRLLIMESSTSIYAIQSEVHILVDVNIIYRECAQSAKTIALIIHKLSTKGEHSLSNGYRAILEKYLGRVC